MPGYVIHLAVAERYLNKHQDKKENYEEFIEGVIFPDSEEDKEKTHYGKGSSNSNLYKFLQEHKLDNSFNRGYFLHLLTDHLFYNYYIDSFCKDLYNDYDMLNKELINEYEVKLPQKVEKFVFYKEGDNFRILNRELAHIVVKEISAGKFEYIATVIPEPSTYAMILGALAIAFVFMRRQTRK